MIKASLPIRTDEHLFIRILIQKVCDCNTINGNNRELSISQGSALTENWNNGMVEWGDGGMME